MKIKKRWFLTGLTLQLLIGCSSPVELRKQTFTIELGEDVYANPALYVKDDTDSSSMKVVPVSIGIGKKENRFVSAGSDYLIVGEYDFELENGNTRIPFKIKIKDTKPPTPSITPSEVHVGLNEAIDWDSVYKASDLSGVSYEAPNDVSQSTGEHDITVKIYDRYGNTSEQPIKVIVG